jgi:uncharacterized protein DUF4035
MSVKRCQQEIDSREFSAWLAYWQLEPWGEGRADLRAGIITSTMANIHRGRDTEAFTPRDFMPTFDAAPPTPEDHDDLIAQQQRMLEALTQAVGGEIH